MRTYYDVLVFRSVTDLSRRLVTHESTAQALEVWLHHALALGVPCCLTLYIIAAGHQEHA